MYDQGTVTTLVSTERNTMITFTKLFVTLILLMIAVAIGQNGWTYFNYGGFKGGWFSSAWVVIAHVAGIALTATAAVYTWKVKV